MNSYPPLVPCNMHAPQAPRSSLTLSLSRGDWLARNIFRLRCAALRMRWLFGFLALLLVAMSAHAAAPLPVDMLARIPVQQDGRLKPLEQYARVTLRQLSGRESLPEVAALPWLMELLFTPELAAERPLFAIKEKSLRDSLGLMEHPNHRYSAREIAAPLTEKRPLVMPIVMLPAKERSPEQQALMDLYQRFSLFSNLQQSFAIILPLNAPRPAAYDLPTPLTYLDLQRIRETLLADAQAIAKLSKGSLESLNAQQRDTVALAFLMERLEPQAALARDLRIMPGTWDAAGDEWFTPWGLMRAGYGSPASGVYLARWRAAALAYRESDATAWAMASAKLAEAAAAQTRGLASLRLWAEWLYVLFAPLNLALVLCLITLGGGIRQKRFPRLPLRSMLGMAFAVLSIALAVRIFIMARPPVGTLYESLLFVAWVVLAAGSLPRTASLPQHIVGAGVAALLLLLAPFFAGEESMGMLTAVLNTDLWLTVHVLCITSGYAACLFAGGMAHLALWRQARADAPPLVTRPLTLYVLAALGLTATGTLLGGVWADQSWGRFWGWDPKENGALLIVLWIIWLLHARQAGQLSARGYVATIALLNIIVALAWFGVNMLGIGLHSYGFTEATATGLALFTLGELLLVFFLVHRSRIHEKLPCASGS